MFIFHLLLIQITLTYSLPHNPAIHIPLYRRSGRFSSHQPANLSDLFQLLQKVEDKYSRTYRSIEDNHLVRRWNKDQIDHASFSEAGLDGKWYTTVQVGKPPQLLELDLDFMSPDFFTILTTSAGGSKFNTFASHSYDPGSAFVNPVCRLSSDEFNISSHQNNLRLEWSVCQPSKSSRDTLSKSGNILGVAPHSQSRSSLSQLTAPSFVDVLYQKGAINSRVWSVTLFDSTTGVLSLGGTLATEFEDAKIRTEVELKYLGQEGASIKVEEEVSGKMAFAMPDRSTYEDHFKWIDVTGAAGWWTGLMSGVWVDGAKVLKNQPFLIDLNCPFVIAPPTAFKQLYSTISGSKSLDTEAKKISTDGITKPFHLFPCLSPPTISFELAGWPFPLSSTSQSTREDAFHGPAGGAFSLGKVEDLFISPNRKTLDNNNTTIPRQERHHGVNSGYCVGIVLQSDMGERQEQRWKASGMRDVWVLGEPFFRGLGVVFDDGHRTGKARMGFRQY